MSGSSRAYNSLDFVGVDQTGEVGVGDDREGEVVVLLELSTLGAVAKESIKLLESTLSPDDESANVTTRSKLEQVETVNASLFMAERIECQRTTPNSLRYI